MSQVKKLDRDDILLRLSSWKIRLNKLFSNIEIWSNDFGEVKIKKTNFPQAREELMQTFDIDSDVVPAIALFVGKKRVSFVPMGLWVIGSNGRVNVTTNENQYILIDLGDNDTESKWMIINPSKRNQRISLDQNLLEKLVRDEGIFA